MKDGLAEYRRKRDFGATEEPQATMGRRGADAESVFVVQIHDASSLHFDFRLEVGGVLKSWAVPKGPSRDPHERRLAMPTEDHPMSYAEFEGVIAPGQYGAGAVIVWDEGTYSTEESSMTEALARGHASFRLHGHKLRGAYSLIRTRRRAGRDAWLLIRKREGRQSASFRGDAVDPVRARSVLTRRTLRQVAAEAEGPEP
ncbi:DNA polymerase ligase N-terminal domain-containing protein [Streptomyces sp. NPDC102441]|uniref:DNA polymerase ligase N-terminal domain-containing protein n=1 Tax=Streptomyces sp. NPDC102441 TaxID=3366176 RepID=UPI0037F5752D